MKKPTNKSKKWQVIHTNYLNRQSACIRKPKKRRHIPLTRPVVIAKMQGREHIQVPEQLTLYAETAAETIRFVCSITERIDAGKNIMLDFSKTQTLTAVGAVYLYSEIDRNNRNNRNNRNQHRSREIIHSYLNGASRSVQFFLRNSGLLHLIDGCTKPNNSMMPIISATGDKYIDRIVDFLTNQAIFERQLENVTSAEAERMATTAITEAMLNVAQHAYSNKVEAYWWMTAAIIDKELNIAFCDRGIGIPKTLPRQKFFERLKKFTPMNDDASMIAAAMEHARTSHPPYQGRGLGTRDIQNLVLKQQRGHLTIISGKGHYRLTGNTNKVETNSIDEDVRGTVIQWALPMDEITN